MASARSGTVQVCCYTIAVQIGFVSVKKECGESGMKEVWNNSVNEGKRPNPLDGPYDLNPWIFCPVNLNKVRVAL
jgi:hypothetical protein